MATFWTIFVTVLVVVYLIIGVYAWLFFSANAMKKLSETWPLIFTWPRVFWR